MILYSFRRCPWAMRARLALAYAGCTVEVCEVSMKHKPAELLALSPKGTVPVLDTGAGVLEESLDIMRWALLQHDPQDWLLRADPAAAVQAHALIARNDSTFKAQVNLYKYASVTPSTLARSTACRPNHGLRSWKRCCKAGRTCWPSTQAWPTPRCCRCCVSSPGSSLYGSPRRLPNCVTGCRAVLRQTCSRP